ncbi:MAG: hypothetical protein GF393_08450 [Armatimonadia bacterium]|nr:hypothetical protein [Armatimonadia bacterium]
MLKLISQLLGYGARHSRGTPERVMSVIGVVFSVASVLAVIAGFAVLAGGYLAEDPGVMVTGVALGMLGNISFVWWLIRAYCYVLEGLTSLLSSGSVRPSGASRSGSSCVTCGSSSHAGPYCRTHGSMMHAGRHHRPGG